MRRRYTSRPLGPGDTVLCQYYNWKDRAHYGHTFEARILARALPGTTFEFGRQFIVQRTVKVPNLAEDLNGPQTLYRREIRRRVKVSR